MAVETQSPLNRLQLVNYSDGQLAEVATEEIVMLTVLITLIIAFAILSAAIIIGFSLFVLGYFASVGEYGHNREPASGF
jgi:hypothetical protein